MSYGNYHHISEFIGGHIVSAQGLESGSDRVEFVFADGRRFVMIHVSDCCESVSVEDVIGDVADLQDATVIDAREETSDTDPEDRAPDKDDRCRDSFTWTFYIIQTNKGAVTIRWLGESNGYYGESVDLELIEPSA